VLEIPTLRSLWQREPAAMRTRIMAMRQAFAVKLAAAGVRQNLDGIARQRGMFSYSCLNAQQLQRLRSERGVYGVDSGRTCVAALDRGNVGAVANAIASLM
jgi:aromatic-amino-acid transaminase